MSEQTMAGAVAPGLTEWQTGKPAIAGWYKTRSLVERGPDVREQRRFFDGGWSMPVMVGYDDDEESAWCAGNAAMDHCQDAVEWQGLLAPHPIGYDYAIVLLGDFMRLPMRVALQRLAEGEL